MAERKKEIYKKSIIMYQRHKKLETIYMYNMLFAWLSIKPESSPDEDWKVHNLDINHNHLQMR